MENLKEFGISKDADSICNLLNKIKEGEYFLDLLINSNSDFSKENINFNECKITYEIKSKEGKLNLEKLLDYFCTREHLDKGNEWRCGQCNKNVEATKNFSIFYVPRILIICLSRFSKRGYGYGKNDEYIGVKTLIGWSDIKKVGKYINDGKMSTDNPRYVMNAILSECESNGVVLSKLCERDNGRYGIYYDRFISVPNGSGAEWRYKVRLDSHGTNMNLEKLVSEIDFYYIPGDTINASMTLQKDITDMCHEGMAFEMMHNGKVETFNLYDLLIPDPDDVNMTVQDDLDHFMVDDITRFKRFIYTVTFGDYISYRRCSSVITSHNRLNFYSDLLSALRNWTDFDLLNSAIVLKYMNYLLYYKLDINRAIKLAKETGGLVLDNIPRQGFYFIGENECMTQTTRMSVVISDEPDISLRRLASYDGFTPKENEGEISLLYRVLKRYESEAMKWMNDPCNKWVISKYYKDGIL